MTPFEKVRDVIIAQMGMSNPKITKETITPATSFLEDLGADSLDIFQIISELEEIYDMEFSDEDAEKIKTVGDAAEYVKKAISA
jgi:acyl carrier protein